MLENKDFDEILLTIMECLKDRLVSNTDRFNVVFSVIFNLVNFLDMHTREKFLNDLEILMESCKKNEDPKNIITELVGHEWKITMTNT
jgi:hypothetical protein